MSEVEDEKPKRKGKVIKVIVYLFSIMAEFNSTQSLKNKCPEEPEGQKSGHFGCCTLQNRTPPPSPLL